MARRQGFSAWYAERSGPAPQERCRLLDAAALTSRRCFSGVSWERDGSHRRSFCSTTCRRARWPRLRRLRLSTRTPVPSQPAPAEVLQVRESPGDVSRPVPVRSFGLPGGVRIDVFVDGDGVTRPSRRVQADLVGRLADTGVVFESTTAKGKDPMELVLGNRSILPGMELGLGSLTLGAKADIFIPAALAYAHVGVPRLVPPNADLVFQVEIVAVDGQRANSKEAHVVAAPARQRNADGPSGSKLPWWVARVVRPPPSRYYLSFCRMMAGATLDSFLARARPVARMAHDAGCCTDFSGRGVFVISGATTHWRAQREWDWQWFCDNLGTRRQLVKWQGPVFTKQESLWDCPVWETSLASYIAYIALLEREDPSCTEERAGDYPRLYLNGWPAFSELPWLRQYAPSMPGIQDVTGELIAVCEELRETFLVAITKQGSEASEDARCAAIEQEYWDMQKLFLSPKGAVTRLHYDNGGAHGWLAQVRGRKLFVCFEPKESKHLHAFAGDEGEESGSFVDPLAEDAAKAWPDFAKAECYATVVHEGEAIVIPQGWWHYAVSLDSSVTVMRNFYTRANEHEFYKRKDEKLEKALREHVLEPKLRAQNPSASKLQEIARKVVADMRAKLCEPDVEQSWWSRVPRTDFTIT
eukprot:TRINITY_DN59701_c0_g1_i1.p1 TRINITY_DN59701_c0_g1~~TRINITY_DN59701_c0_g1_i1.p1  ORF type:complete len:642 (+),score=53.81 TRINITY_DN59701_c0_g1_i1:47-1972(+)